MQNFIPSKFHGVRIRWIYTSQYLQHAVEPMEVISGHFWTFRNVKKERKNLFTKMVVTLRSMDTFKLLKRLQRYLTPYFQPIRNQKRKKGWWENDPLREQNSIHFKTHLKRIILNILLFKWKTIIILRKLQNLNPK